MIPNLVPLTPEDLLAGAENTFEIEIPAEFLYPARSDETGQSRFVHLRPLTIGTFQLILKAARQDAGLIPLLLIKESLIQPALSLEQIKRLPLGTVNFLIENIRQISGLTGKKNPSGN